MSSYRRALNRQARARPLLTILTAVSVLSAAWVGNARAAGVAGVAGAAGNPIVRIMAVGDSITEDNPANFPNTSGGWRAPLYEQLTAAGRSTTFVGSHNRDSPVLPGLSGHDAYGGWATCDFFTDGRASVREPTHAPTWDITQAITDAAPDVVLVHIGTNNYINQQYFDRGRVSTLECPPTRANMSRFFDAIVNHPRHPRVVISTIEDASTVNGTDSINSLIASYVAEQQTAGKQVCLSVEPASMAGLTLPDDPFHLNAAGKAAVAAAFYGPTLAALDRQCAASSSTTPVTPPPSGSERLYANDVVPPQSIDSGPSLVNAQRINFACAGTVNGVWWYRLAGDTGAVAIQAWQNDVTMARGVATYPAGVGWTYMPFTRPLSLLAGEQYVIAVHHPNGAYPYAANGFTGRTVNAPQHCMSSPVSTATSKNGLFRYSATPANPTESYRDNEYWLGPDFTRTCLQLRCLQTDWLWSVGIVRQQLTYLFKDLKRRPTWSG